VLTTGTGSGKSLSYFIPIVDRALRRGKGEPRITAIVVYPMNALCNSQLEELRKFLEAGYPEHAAPVTFARYTGQESQPERDALARRPPDILLTNYMMLELILTRQHETDQAVMRAARGLDFLVLDELHTYRGRQGADVALLVRRVREACNRHLLAVGTSATMASEGAADDRSQVVAAVATRMFGVSVHPGDVVTETLARVTPEGSEPDAAALATAIDDSVSPEVSFEDLRRHPLAAWIETELGLQREEGKWVRTRQPRNVRSAAERLAGTTGRPVETCERVLKDFLLQAHATRDADGRSLFAFRLHQFVTGGGDLFGTLEPEGSRYFTLNGQQYQPGTGREKRLFAYCFCRECGQEYLPVWASEDGAGIAGFDPRDLDDHSADEAELIHGFFWPRSRGPLWADTGRGSVPGRLAELGGGRAASSALLPQTTAETGSGRRHGDPRRRRSARLVRSALVALLPEP
jgi:DEAD/DEAH box helicase